METRAEHLAAYIFAHKIRWSRQYMCIYGLDLLPDIRAIIAAFLARLIVAESNIEFTMQEVGKLEEISGKVIWRDGRLIEARCIKIYSYGHFVTLNDDYFGLNLVLRFRYYVRRIKINNKKSLLTKLASEYIRAGWINGTYYIGMTTMPWRITDK